MTVYGKTAGDDFGTQWSSSLFLSKARLYVTNGLASMRPPGKGHIIVLAFVFSF